MITGTFSVLIVDAHAMFIYGVKAILERNVKTITEIYTANSGEEALGYLEGNKIDLLITDINIPGMTGFELTKVISEKYPETKILVLTIDDSKSSVEAIMDAEADGYLLKNVGEKEFIFAISQIMNNGTFYSGNIIQVMMELDKNGEMQSKPCHIRNRKFQLSQAVKSR
jgi:DNA-binding NarL/FixJ family response regulator